MKIAQLSDDFAVAPQIQPMDVRDLAAAHFGTIICNRPDGEEAGQPDAESIRCAAQAAGLAFYHIPVSGGEFPAAAIRAFAKVREGADGKVLAYCRTGTRSITLESLANMRGLSVEERIKQAGAAGYDISGLRDKLGE